MKTQSVFSQADLLWSTMLEMSYEEIKKSCRINQLANEICNSGSFWRAKIIYDFPSYKLTETNLNKMEAAYLLFLARYLDRKVIEMKREDFYNAYSPYKSRLFNIVREIRRVKSQKSPDELRLKQLRGDWEITREIVAGITSRFLEETSKMTKQATRYWRKARETYPLEKDYRYIEIIASDEDMRDIEDFIRVQDFEVLNIILLKRKLI